MIIEEGVSESGDKAGRWDVTDARYAQGAVIEAERRPNPPALRRSESWRVAVAGMVLGSRLSLERAQVWRAESSVGSLRM